MICDDAVMKQEKDYFQSLPFAFRFERSGSSLVIYNDRNVVILQYAGG